MKKTLIIGCCGVGPEAMAALFAKSSCTVSEKPDRQFDPEPFELNINSSHLIDNDIKLLETPLDHYRANLKFLKKCDNRRRTKKNRRK